MATRLFGFYRASEANDAETFIAGATAILSRYPEEVVRLVCDPVAGLPAEDGWLPSLARIRVVCDEAMAPIRDQERRDRVRQATLKLRFVSGKAPLGSPEHGRVCDGFSRLGEALAPPRATPPR